MLNLNVNGNQNASKTHIHYESSGTTIIDIFNNDKHDDNDKS